MFINSATLAREWSVSTFATASSRSHMRLCEVGSKAPVPWKKLFLSKAVQKNELAWAKVQKNWSISK